MKIPIAKLITGIIIANAIVCNADIGAFNPDAFPYNIRSITYSFTTKTTFSPGYKSSKESVSILDFVYFADSQRWRYDIESVGQNGDRDLGIRHIFTNGIEQQYDRNNHRINVSRNGNIYNFGKLYNHILAPFAFLTFQKASNSSRMLTGPEFTELTNISTWETFFKRAVKEEPLVVNGKKCDVFRTPSFLLMDTGKKTYYKVFFDCGSLFLPVRLEERNIEGDTLVITVDVIETAIVPHLNNIRFPKEIKTITYDNKGKKVLFSCQATMNNIEINRDLGDNVFALDYKLGDHIIDQDNQVTIPLKEGN